MGISVLFFLTGSDRFLDIFDQVDIIRRNLVYVIQPVAIQQVGMCTPFQHRFPGWIIIREVIVRDMNLLSQIDVAPVFLGKGILAVLEMTDDKDLTVIFGNDDIRTDLFIFRKNR